MSRYRVLAGPRAGEILPESETVECSDEFDGCDGTGTVSVRIGGGDRGSGGYDSYGDGERDCDVCDGIGRVLDTGDAVYALAIEGEENPDGGERVAAEPHVNTVRPLGGDVLAVPVLDARELIAKEGL